MFSVLVVFLLFISCTYSDTIDSKKIVLLDYNPVYNNFLFRGNEPKVTNASGDFFAYELLTEYLQQQANTNGKNLPDNYWLLDLKLYYDLNLSRDMTLENDFFAMNPTLGRFTPQQILGDLTSPNIYPDPFKTSMARSLNIWQHDKLPTFIPHIKQLLNTAGPQNRPVVIYVHCECGCDRTGEISGSYMMKYHNWTFQSAYAWDESIAGRFILPNHKWAMEWYCEYLKDVEGIPAGVCDDD